MREFIFHVNYFFASVVSTGSAQAVVISIFAGVYVGGLGGLIGLWIFVIPLDQTKIDRDLELSTHTPLASKNNRAMWIPTYLLDCLLGIYFFFLSANIFF